MVLVGDRVPEALSLNRNLRKAAISLDCYRREVIYNTCIYFLFPPIENLQGSWKKSKQNIAIINKKMNNR